MAYDKTIRASDSEYNLLNLIRGAQVAPATVKKLVINHLSQQLTEPAETEPATPATPGTAAGEPAGEPAATARPGSPDYLRDNYKALKEVGYTVAEARKYRYLSQEKINYLLDAKKAPPDPEPATAKEKKKGKSKSKQKKKTTPTIIETKIIPVEVD